MSFTLASPQVGVGLTGTCVVITTIFSLHYVFRFIRYLWTRRRRGYDALGDTPDEELYSDEDGTATEESMAEYSVMWQTSGILLGSLAGFAVTLAAAVMASGKENQRDRRTEMLKSWAMVASWGWFLVHTLCLMFEHGCIRVFEHAQLLFWLSLAVIIAAGGGGLTTRENLEREDVGLLSGQLAAAFLVWISAISVPRRPDVYRDGKVIDQMRTSSLLSRYTFYWASRILQKAIRKGKLEESDIPGLYNKLRAHELLVDFNREDVQKIKSAYLQVLRAHWAPFVRVYIGSTIGVICEFTPPVIMNQILKTLEDRENGLEVTLEGYWWVALLGFVKLVESFIYSSVYWTAFFGVMIPIRAQLSAVVFAKTMRKKDVKGSQKEDDEKTADASEVAAPGDDEEDELKNMKQGTINLLSVDSERIALFTSISNIFVEATVGTAYGFVYIWVMLGWQSLLAGLCVVVLTSPFNIYFSKKYSAAQDDLMKVRDKKMAVISEALQGIRQIKFQAQEARWEEKIRQVREEELQTLRRVFLADVAVISAWIINPVFLSAVSLSVYAIINGSMSASVAFPALAIFGGLEWTLSIVPEMVTDGFDALISMRRIKRYLDSAEKETVLIDSDRIAMTDATIAWAADNTESPVSNEDRFALQNLTLEFPRNELSIVSGRTGSGKSLLLNALLGEADVLKGTIEMPPQPDPEFRFDDKAHPGNWVLPHAIAFVAQIPWIENGSLKDNILFGLPYEEGRFKKTLHACALEKDLDSLPDGVLTEIGANGINLSGGQRWRVSFARAVYSRAGILILDDIFSAVDAHVGKHIYEYGLTGELMQGRTRILVTHHLKLCVPKAKYAIVLANGVVENQGSVEELQAKGIMDKLIETVEAAETQGGEDREEAILLDNDEDETNVELARMVTRESVMSHRSRRQSKSVDVNDKTMALKAPMQFVQDEEREQGAVKWGIYKKYLQASGGIPIWLIMAALFTLQEGLVLGRSFWVKVWTSQAEVESTMTGVKGQSVLQFSMGRIKTVVEENHSLTYWIGVYTILSFVSCVLGTWRYAYLFFRSLAASRVMFDDLVKVVMRAPLRWLDTVPTGRILNRFSKDFETVDSKLINDIAYLLWNALGLIGINIAALYLSPYIMILAVLCFAVSIQYAMYYLSGARDLKRMESNSRSPIFELFGATLSGVATIRAFSRSSSYIEKMFSRLDLYSQRTYYVWLVNRWIGLRLSIIGSVFAVLVGVAVVAVKSIDAAMAGFALSFALNYTQNVIWALRRYANMELDMNSTERIVEYTMLPTEDQGGVVPPASWPTEGRVQVEDLVVGYAPELPPVLKGVSFEVNPGERVGIVGRTGAGKSSMTLALFQFIRASSGRILIDGIDISTLRLHDLRSRIAIIPQDPVLFSGTVRSNLDPFNEHDDTELLDALRRVHLIPPVATSAPASIASSTTAADNKNIFTSLSSLISESGLNLSQGQRQLLCLARAIVSRPRILVLDEATSAVDMETDSLIQETIREEFRGVTALVIAHRLQTVVDYERVLVLGEGKVVEYDSPAELVKKKGVFWEMCWQTGEGEWLERVALGDERDGEDGK